MSVEELRLTMIKAFKYFRDLPQPHPNWIGQANRYQARAAAWEAYARARETYLKASAKENGYFYEPLRICTLS